MTIAYDIKLIDPAMKSPFKRNSGYWYRMYHHTLKGKGSTEDEKIDWQAVQSVQTQVVRDLTGRSDDMSGVATKVLSATIVDGEYETSNDEA